jgi:cellulose synthase/poly-beta-1,6-N-acetylglucosamine synthase-like glycosyltransferase
MKRINETCKRDHDSLVLRMRPTVSVVVMTYNQVRYIEATLESVFKQTYPRWRPSLSTTDLRMRHREFPSLSGSTRDINGTVRRFCVSCDCSDHESAMHFACLRPVTRVRIYVRHSGRKCIRGVSHIPINKLIMRNL